jgi:arabinose-5-phosphate isomerase
MSPDLAVRSVVDVMTRQAITISADDLLSKALLVQETSRVTALIVKDGETPIGILHYLDLLRVGVT